MDQDFDQLADTAFATFHNMGLQTDTVETRVNEAVAIAAAVKLVDQVCPHDLIGVPYWLAFSIRGLFECESTIR